MLRRRGTAFVVVAVAVLAVTGCGRDDFANDPQPAVPAEVTAKIGNDGVAVSPKEFGAGLVSLTVANLTTKAATLVVQGPVDAESGEIPPAGTDTLKLEMKSGNYEASADGVPALPANFTVGPERPSGQNDLLLP